MQTTKPIYDKGTILAIRTSDGAHRYVNFFQISARLKSGNYHAVEVPTLRIRDTPPPCEARPDEAGSQNYLGTVNLKWYKNFNAFCHQVPVLSISNEIYDPSKKYYDDW